MQLVEANRTVASLQGSDVISVYQAENSTDAHLIKNLLAQAGIDSYIRGEYLQGGLGDIPVSGMISVCVSPEAAVTAREIVREWDEAKFEHPESTDTSAESPAPRATRAKLGFPHACCGLDRSGNRYARHIGSSSRPQQ